MYLGPCNEIDYERALSIVRELRTGGDVALRYDRRTFAKLTDGHGRLMSAGRGPEYWRAALKVKADRAFKEMNAADGD